MRTQRFPTLLAAALALAGASAADAARAADAPRGKVYAVLLLDTTARGLGAGAKKDGDYVEDILNGGIGKDLLQTTRLEGKDATWDALAAYLQGIQPTPNDVLFCFIAGHGGTSKQEQGKDAQQLLMFGSGQRDLRARRDVRAQLLDKRAGLTILISDSCNHDCPPLMKSDENPAQVFSAPGSAEVSEAFRPLFLEAKGVVDINASFESVGAADAGQFAWFDNDGGVFARALHKTFYDLDAAKKKATWPEFYYRLVSNTNDIFKSYRNGHVPEMDKLDQAGKLNGDDQEHLKWLKGQDTQRPEAYYLTGVRLGILVYGTNGKGMEVKDVPFNSPAAGKLKLKEVILKVNDQDVLYTDDWNRVVGSAIKEGQTRLVFKVVGTEGQMRTEEINLAAP